MMGVMLNSEQDLLDFFGADNQAQLEKWTFRGTDAGITPLFLENGVVYTTILEGTDVEYSYGPIEYPFNSDEIEDALDYLEISVDLEWHRHYFTCIVCDGEIPEDAFDGMMEFYWDAIPACSPDCEVEFMNTRGEDLYVGEKYRKGSCSY